MGIPGSSPLWKRVFWQAGTTRSDDVDLPGLTCLPGCLAMTGLRHVAILKLVGTEAPDMGGVLELYPINGKKSLLGQVKLNVSRQMCLESTSAEVVK